MEEALCMQGISRRKGIQLTHLPFPGIDSAKRVGEFCKHKKSGYAAVVREFYSNLVRRKENSVFVRGVWVPYGAETINVMYRMEGQKHGSKYKKIADRPNREKDS